MVCRQTKNETEDIKARMSYGYKRLVFEILIHGEHLDIRI